MIFRTKGLKATGLLTIPFYCFVLIALLHPDTGNCGKKKDQQEVRAPLLDDQDSEEKEVGPPPPYSPEAGVSAEVFPEGHLNIDDICYSVRDTGEVASVTMQSLDRGMQYLDISYKNLVPKRHHPGDYITAPIEFSTFNHHLEEQIQYAGVLWLFPSGIGSGAKRGRFLVTLQNFHKKATSTSTSTSTSTGGSYSNPTRLRRILLKETDTQSISFHTALTMLHPEIHKSESVFFNLSTSEQTLTDLGNCFYWKKFKDQSGRNTLRLSLTPGSQIRRNASLSPENGYSFVYEAPCGALLHERHEDGTPTPQAKICLGIGFGWIEIDGQFINFAIQNRTPCLTTYIAAPSGYDELSGIQEHYLPHEAETPLSSDQKKVIKEKALQKTKEDFKHFIRSRDFKIYWNAPDGNRHLVGQFGGSDSKFQERGFLITKPCSSPIRYQRLFRELGGKNAIFHLVVSAPASDLDQASHSEFPGHGRGKDSVTPHLPPIVKYFQQLHINGRKVGSSAGKSQ